MGESRSALLNLATRRGFAIAFCTAVLGITVTRAQSDDVARHAGGEVTIVTAVKKGTALVQSTRFR